MVEVKRFLQEQKLTVLVELRRQIEVEICYRMKSLDAEQLELMERG